MTTDTLAGRELDAAVATVMGFAAEKDVLGRWLVSNHPGLLSELIYYSAPDCRGLPLMLAWLRERGWTVWTECEDTGNCTCIAGRPREFGTKRYEAAGDTLPEAVARVCIEIARASRCEVTGNLCGTDTRPVGQPCQCASCRAAAKA